MNFEIHYCDFHKVNPIRDKIDRPTGSGDYLILHFLTPMVLNQMGEYINVQSGGCILFTPNMPQQYQAINRFVNSYIHFELDNPSIFDELDIPKNKIFYPTISDKIDLCFRQLHIENIEKNLHMLHNSLKYYCDVWRFFMLKNYVFDLYGTLVDIRTNEWKPYLWKKMTEFYGLYGAKYTPKEMEKAYHKYADEELETTYEKMKGKNGISCLDDAEIQLEKVFQRLLL